MLFNSLLFLYYFLPSVLLGNILLSPRFRNLFLLIASLIFFAWGGVSYTLLFIASILLNFAGGIFIDKARSVPRNKEIIFITTVGLNLLLLCIFKYGGFFVENLNLLNERLGLAAWKVPKIILPIGISFYTFHGLSYITDVYRGTTLPQRKFADLSLYISFFPQLIAGPIIRYKDVANQLSDRTFSWEGLNEGMYRFIIGLGKKVLIANTLAYLADVFFNADPGSMSILDAWTGILVYTFQIYFDFSAYSDMAIGLARCFGFVFRENFNFPYLAESIKDFWRRWHISLSSWFKDYVYIPLGGNRKGKFKTYRNLIIVFFLTGLWHGASWSFVVWGFFHGFFIILESTGIGKLQNRLWKPLKIAYTFIIVSIAWVLFRANTLSYGLNYLKAMFGLNGNMLFSEDARTRHITSEQWIVMGIAIAGSFGLFRRFANSNVFGVQEQLSSPSVLQGSIRFIFSFFILFVCTVYLTSGTYNPFIYFRF